MIDRILEVTPLYDFSDKQLPIEDGTFFVVELANGARAGVRTDELVADVEAMTDVDVFALLEAALPPSSEGRLVGLQKVR